MIKVNNGLKVKGYKYVRGHNPQKGKSTPPPPLRDVCVQCENNLANALRDIVRKTELIIHHQLKSIITLLLKIEGHKLGQRS